jgi:ribosomal protein L29
MATKKTSFKDHSPEELAKLVLTKREELRGLRFSASGSKNKNVKQAKTLRKEIARALTETSARKNTAAAA